MYEDLPKRIQDIYDSCMPEEQQYLFKILQELSETGTSETYENVWLSDYKEIPVNIDTFLCDDAYLGKATRNGDAIYPHWRQVMNEIFNAGNKYEEVVFTGATRIGKSSTAISCVSYMLYRLMCLKDPQQYFGKKDVSKFSIMFFNITKDLARGVAFREFNDTLRMSPWFNAHGTFSKSEENFYYIPEGGKVVVEFGSLGVHALGKQVFCMVGSTKVVTPDDVKTLEELYSIGKPVEVLSFSNKLDIEFKQSKGVQLIKYVHDTLRIELLDGSTIEGTPDHMLMLTDGSYEQLGRIVDNQSGCSEILEVATGQGIQIKHCQMVHYDEAIPVYDVLDVEDNHNFIVATNYGGVVSHNCGMMDEVNFARSGIKDIQKAKQNMRDTYNTISARIKGTFRKNGEVCGKLFAVSSKRSDSDFMEDYVRTQMSSGAGDHMYVDDKPQWEVLPKSMFSPGMFYIAVGDRHKRGFVVPDNQTNLESLEELRGQGYQLLTPPINMKPEFVADFDIALRDLAGISIPGALSFITQDSLTECISHDRKNCFYNDILQIGVMDNLSIEEFFHMKEIEALKRYPTYIHLDLSLTTDKSGISGLCICGRSDKSDIAGNTVSQIMLAHLFSVSLEAPRGDKIPYDKITTFLCWLKKNGLNIKGISRDQYQSEYMAQLLEMQGFKVSKLSLDRTPDGYIALRSVLVERRIDLLDCQLLQDELIHLQRDSVTGAVDHPVGGCFTGDTQVRIAGGVPTKICQLMKIPSDQLSKYEVFTVNERTGTHETKRIRRVFKTKITYELVKVVIDDGSVVRCTPDHRFMLTDRTYEEIQNIRSGTSVMSMFYGDYKGNILHERKIVSVERMKFPGGCPVYDLEVEDNHNFALSSGVIVHNSKDVADSLAGAVWNAIISNPGVPVPTKKVAHVVSAVNRPNGSTVHNSNNNVKSGDLSSMFSNLYKNPPQGGRKR